MLQYLSAAVCSEDFHPCVKLDSKHYSPGPLAARNSNKQLTGYPLSRTGMTRLAAGHGLRLGMGQTRGSTGMGWPPVLPGLR
ncbi:hypothetical protein [Kamptonema formosum]|uniref:hypothetical protein n=1 Tax=Kamptonema formosum TaxID=331992 RepID=UPI000344F9B4|nr:hypothetical protein [Oscillatoria sp. PCC 10802]